eukprot:4296842-Karenia_brevis.AAC.1
MLQNARFFAVFKKTGSCQPRSSLNPAPGCVTTIGHICRPRLRYDNWPHLPPRLRYDNWPHLPPQAALRQLATFKTTDTNMLNRELIKFPSRPIQT